MNTQINFKSRLAPSTFSRLLCSLMFGLAVAASSTGSAGSEITQLEDGFWTKLYHELHPGAQPKWAEYGGRHAWAKQEAKRLEPILVQIIQGHRGDIPWRHSFFVAHDIATKPICDALCARIQPVLDRIAVPGVAVNVADSAELASSLSILAQAADTRAIKPLNRVVQSLQHSQYSHITARQCLLALRKVGNATSLESLRKMPLRKTNERIDRMAGLTENVINARLRGTTVSPNAQQELRDVATRFVRSALAEDLAGYVACFPYGAAQVIDRGDLKEFLNHVDGRPGLAAVDKALAAGKPFTVDLDKLRATLLCGVSFELDCVLEVDGWKIANLKRIPAP